VRFGSLFFLFVKNTITYHLRSGDAADDILVGRRKRADWFAAPGLDVIAGVTMARPRTSAFVGVSLDGFLARPDGSLDWLTPFEGEEHGYKSFFESIDTLVIGRKTYEFVLTIPWPYGGKRCIVMTHRPLVSRNGERAYAGEPAGLLLQLEAEGARHVYVDGGAVIRAFLAAGLLDDLTMTIVPSLIGEGLPLFGGVKLESGLVLEEVKSFNDKLVQLRYRMPKG
jgi:dihydrofolate reductase